MFFLPGFLWAGIYYLETLVRLGTSGNVISWGLFFSLIFGGVLALLIYGGATLLGEKSRRITLGIILFLLGFIFASQLVYYNMFGTFNTIYSVRHAGQATEFWREALYEIGRNWYLVLLAFVPFGLYLFIGKKINNTPKRRPYVL